MIASRSQRSSSAIRLSCWFVKRVSVRRARQASVRDNVPLIALGDVLAPNQGQGQTAIARPRAELLVKKQGGGAAIPSQRPEIMEIDLNQICPSQKLGGVGIPVGIVQQDEAARPKHLQCRLGAPVSVAADVH